MDMSPIQLFKALSDPTRLRCLVLLEKEAELCVCELTHALALPQPKVSHHLAILRKLALVSDRKHGLWIYYRINPQIPQWVAEIIHSTVAGIEQYEPYASDMVALAEMPDRLTGVCSA